MKKQWISDGISCLFILLFFYAAVSKLLAGPTFLEQVGQSPLLTSHADLVVIIVPLTEIMLAVLLMKTKTRLVALYGCFTLMILFTAYIIAITRFSDYVPCSCGGILERLDWNQHLVFNCVFIALSVVAVLFYKPSFK